ncbi:MAG: hypothetical protein JO300_02840 [Silvibacterium sp.]|nr:hypothetical protein [Silvibacterium sp.]
MTPEKSTLSGMPKENSSSPAQTVGPEAVSGGSGQVRSTTSGPGESSYRFLQSLRAAALYVPEVQRFGEGLLQRHRSVLIASAGTEVGSRSDSPASRPVVQLAKPTAQQPVTGAAVALPTPTLGNPSSNENPSVVRAAALDPLSTSKASPLTDLSPARNAASHAVAHDPENPASVRDSAKPDSNVESPSLHSAGEVQVAAESTVQTPGAFEMILARHASPDSTTANPGDASFAGEVSEPAAAQDPSVSTAAGTGPASLAGFEAAPTASRTSLKTGVATSAGTPVDMVRSHLQSFVRSSPQSTAHRDASAARETAQPFFRPDAPHAVLRSDSVERPQSGNVALHEYGTMTATNYVLRSSAGRAYERRDEQSLAVPGATNLQRDASALMLVSATSAALNRRHLFPASATPSLHSSTGPAPVPMHHASMSERESRSIAVPAQGDLLFRSTLSTPPVSAAATISPVGLLSAGQAVNPTAPSLRNADVAQLANRVYELLVRRLSSERQRRGT